MFRALAVTVTMISAGACGFLRTERQLLVSTDQLLLAVGDSTRPQWAVIRKHGGPLALSFYQYDNFDAPKRFRWQSSAPEVVSVDSRGMIYAHAPGVASIRATTGKLTARPLPVTVYDPETEGDEP